MGTGGYPGIWKKTLVGTGGKVIVEREKTYQGRRHIKAAMRDRRVEKLFDGSKNFYHRSREAERPA